MKSFFSLFGFGLLLEVFGGLLWLDSKQPGLSETKVREWETGAIWLMIGGIVFILGHFFLKEPIDKSETECDPSGNEPEMLAKLTNEQLIMYALARQLTNGLALDEKALI